MNAQHDVNRVVRSWLREDDHESADRILGVVLDRLDTTPQRRPLGSAWRSNGMNTYAKLLAGAAAVLVVAVVGYQLLPGRLGPGTPTVAPTSSPTSAPSPTTTTTTVTIAPFGRDGFGMCPDGVAATVCAEDPRDDTMTFALDIPAGWELADSLYVNPVDAPLPSDVTGAGVLITRGNWLNSEPCRTDEVVNPDVPVGPTADDLADALEDSANLDVSAPMLKGLAGYSASYLEIRVPADISMCERYQPFEETIYAQGPNQLWKLWILDVDGIRVVVQGFEFPATSEQHQAELEAVVRSIRITR